MNSHALIGIGLGLYFNCFVAASLFRLPQMHSYLVASSIGCATIVYGLLASNFGVARLRLIRWSCLFGAFLFIVAASYVLNANEYDTGLTLKVIGYTSLFGVSTLIALIGNNEAARACMLTYLGGVMFALLTTLAFNNTSPVNHRLLGPLSDPMPGGTGLHHNEVGLLAMTSVTLATMGGWRALLLVSPVALYTAFRAGSRGSLLGIIVAITVFIAIREFLSRSDRRSIRSVPIRGVLIVITIMLCCMILVMTAWPYLADDVLQLNDKNRGLSSGFTGRFDVWRGMAEDWLQSPIIGRGYGIVRGEALEAGNTADGGFLLLTAELGAAGMILFFVLIIYSLGHSWHSTRVHGDSHSITTFVYVVTFCFINLVESRFVGTGSIGLGMFIYVSSLCLLNDSASRRNPRNYGTNSLIHSTSGLRPD